MRKEGRPSVLTVVNAGACSVMLECREAVELEACEESPTVLIELEVV